MNPLIPLCVPYIPFSAVCLSHEREMTQTEIYVTKREKTSLINYTQTTKTKKERAFYYTP